MTTRTTKSTVTFTRPFSLSGFDGEQPAGSYSVETDEEMLDGVSFPAYRRLATKAGKVWREHGALDYREWVAEDVKVGKLTSFPRSVKMKPGETVVFSWITYKSRAQRDRVNAKVMADARLKSMMDPKSMPFDTKRMIYGGFKRLVKA